MEPESLQQFKYKYETHLHTLEASRCARNTAIEMMEALKAAGYNGTFITNHAWGGNTSVDRSLPWRKWVEEFSKPYYIAHEWGLKNDFTVMFGYESGYRGTEFLIYGITPEWMADHEELHDATIPEQYEIIHNGGGLVIQAHPYRKEDYIPEVRLFPEYCDGLESVNATHSSHLSQSHNIHEWDIMAIDLARKTNKPMTAGSDIHCVNLFGGGMLTASRICSAKDYIRLIKSDEMYLLLDGDRIYDRYGNIISRSDFAED